MNRSITLRIDGRRVVVEPNTTVAVALVDVGAGRTSVRGARREALCGMGVCWECRARVDDVADVRTCLVQVRDGMKVETHD